MATNYVKASAVISDCKRYRFTLTRIWDGRPALLVVMFNPSTADASTDDPTISLLCQIASHNGYGGIVVVNLIPLRSSRPADAIDMANNWDKRRDWYARDRLHQNLSFIEEEVRKAGAILLAYGALGARCVDWADIVLEEIETAAEREDGSKIPLLCLGRTTSGYPLHPLARGKLKVRKDARMIPWAHATESAE